MLCIRCSDKAVYRRAYSGEALCSRCFSNSIVRKVAKTIARYRMIRYGDRIAVAVSGGKDSLALLHILNMLSKEHDNELIAITIDEGISNYREESLDIAKEFSNGLGIKHYIFSYKDLFDHTLDEMLAIRDINNIKFSSCSICGTFRRRALDIASMHLDADVLATAHNLDDFIQTFFMNIFAGDVDRIGFMYPEPIEYSDGLRKVKPLMSIYENEIAFYAMINNIPFQADQCPHMKESIRNSVRRFLNMLEKEHAGIKYNMLNSMLKISKVMRDNSDNKKKLCRICNMESSMDVCSACSMRMMLKSI